MIGLAGAAFWGCVLAVWYSYLGYPAALAVLTTGRRRAPGAPAAPDSAPRTVTIVVAAHDEEAVIEAKLANCRALEHPADRLQVVVAADGSTDGTAEIVARWADRGVELVHRPERAGKAAAIDRAVERATGEILVLSDANNHYAPDALRHLLAPFDDPTVGMVTGAKDVEGDDGLGAAERLYWRYESFVKERESRLGCCVAVAGEILALRRDLWEPIPSHVVNDDFWLAMRVAGRGLQVRYAPAARSIEAVSATAADERVRRARIVAGRYQAMSAGVLPWRRPVVAWQVASHKFTRPLVPVAAIGAAVATIAAVAGPGAGRRRGLGQLGRPWGWMALGAQVAFYGSAVAGRRAGARRDGWRKALFVPTFLVNSNAAALVGLVRHLRGGQDARWQRVARRAPAVAVDPTPPHAGVQP